MKTIDFKARKASYRNEMERLLSRDELAELDRRINRLLSLPYGDVSLNVLDECLADYGLEPDYLCAYVY